MRAGFSRAWTCPLCGTKVTTDIGLEAQVWDSAFGEVSADPAFLLLPASAKVYESSQRTRIRVSGNRHRVPFSSDGKWLSFDGLGKGYRNVCNRQVIILTFTEPVRGRHKSGEPCLKRSIIALCRPTFSIPKIHRNRRGE